MQNFDVLSLFEASSDNKVHGANMGPIWGRQDPGVSHVVPVNFAIWVVSSFYTIEVAVVIVPIWIRCEELKVNITRKCQLW